MNWILEIMQTKFTIIKLNKITYNIIFHLKDLKRKISLRSKL